jgi:hypothetical protein
MVLFTIQVKPFRERAYNQLVSLSQVRLCCACAIWVCWCQINAIFGPWADERPPRVAPLRAGKSVFISLDG